MRRLVLGLVAIAATVGPMVMAGPAQAEHTLCDNEPSDIHTPTKPLVGADLQTPREAYICVEHTLLVFRTRGSVTICSHYTANGNPADDRCEVRQGV